MDGDGRPHWSSLTTPENSTSHYGREGQGKETKSPCNVPCYLPPCSAAKKKEYASRAFSLLLINTTQQPRQWSVVQIGALVLRT